VNTSDKHLGLYPHEESVTHGAHSTKIEISALGKYDGVILSCNTFQRVPQMQSDRISVPFATFMRDVKSLALEGVEGEKFARRVTPGLRLARGPEKSLISNPRGR